MIGRCTARSGEVVDNCRICARAAEGGLSYRAGLAGASTTLGFRGGAGGLRGGDCFCFAAIFLAATASIACSRFLPSVSALVRAMIAPMSGRTPAESGSPRFDNHRKPSDAMLDPGKSRARRSVSERVIRMGTWTARGAIIVMVGCVLNCLCNAACSIASYRQHSKDYGHTFALSRSLYSSYPRPFSRHSLAKATANLSLMTFILGRTSLASVIIRPRCHNVTGKVTAVRTHIVKPMIVAQAGNGDDKTKFASGSKNDGSVVVEIVSITTGVEVLWYRRDGKLAFGWSVDVLVALPTARVASGGFDKFRRACPACLDGPATQSSR